jgi:uncharacterized membrane protein YedE/YeeE
MYIAWSEFTPLASFTGGAMIGAAALLLMLLNGRVMGMSGILTGLMVGHADRLWRLAFVAGVIIGPFLFIAFSGAPVNRQPVASGPMLYIAAFLVGLGTAVGSGCTSGAWHLRPVTLITTLGRGGYGIYGKCCDHGRLCARFFG